MENQNYLISGATSGIGFATAKILAEAGANLALISRSEDDLKAIREELPGNGHHYAALDMTDENVVKDGFKALSSEMGKFCGAVFCAGGHLLKPLIVSKAKDYEEQYKINFITAMNGVKFFAKHAENGASIVLTSSAAAMSGSAAKTAYASSKAALLTATKCLAVELAPKKIRVNSVIPGVVLTPMTKGFFSKLSEDQVKAITEEHLLGVGEPEDVANLNQFLLSDKARWITGSNIVIDGGLTCH